MRPRTRPSISFVVVAAFAGCQGNGDKTGPTTAPDAPAPGAMNGTVLVQVDDLHFRASDDWAVEAPASQARKIQYVLPSPVEGSAADASLIIYYFGPGGAGTVQANLDRWIGQFADADGNPPAGAAIEQRTIAGLPVHQVVVSGRYVAETSPGSGEHYDLPDQRMLAAVIEAPAGRYYFKAVGPRATMEHHWAALEAFLDSMELHPTGDTPAGPGHP